LGRRLQENLRKADPRFYGLLLASPTLEEARQKIYTYLDKRERELYSADGDLHPLEHSTARECIRVLKSLLAPRNEAQAGFSTLESLWRSANVRLASGQAVRDGSPAGQQVAQGFILEFVHLLRGIRGQSGIAGGWLGPVLAADGIQPVDFSQIEGRAAGVARSRFLDHVGEQVWGLIDAHPTGLDPALIACRERNKKRILDFFDATPHHWDNHAWQLGHIFKGPQALPWLDQLLPMTAEEREAIRLCVEHGIPFGITPYYLSLFDCDSDDRRLDAQLRSQVIPPMHYVNRMIEHQADREHYFDFMGEHDTSPIGLVTRRYASIAILKGYDTCPQICVYCQRNWEITGPMEASALPPREKLDAALDWFADHPSVRDVLITELLGRYVEPGRRNVGIVTHIESAAEVTPELAAAVHRLRRQGIYVYNQQVLTLDTSRRFQTVANRVAMKKAGVDPYYTFYPKGKEETSDYTTPLARVLQERKEEARLLPGAFRTDEPVFNVPRLGKNHVRAWQDRELIAIRPDGRRVYLWHPWEKGITPTKPWIYVDNAIHKYLQGLERLGEDSADYASIWYYY
jgi:lysine 2,3-aminomutase